MSAELKQRVILVPEDLMQENLIVIHLKHPRTGSDALCAIDSSNRLFEIVHYGDDISSWFIGESVSDNGCMYFLTIADPLFFIISYVSENDKYCPIEDLLVDGNFPDVHYLSKCCGEEEFQNIFDSKESAGYKVFKYNERKTLYWLQLKAKSLAAHLKSKDIDLSDGSKASILKTNNDSKSEEEYLLYSCHVISEYLSDQLSCKLFSSLGLEEKRENDKLKTNGSEENKKQNIEVKPEDDYSSQLNAGSLQEKQKKKLTAAQKQLMRVDKTGMKSISSFFFKK